MKVQELIDELSAYPGNEEVGVRDLANSDMYPVVAVAPFNLGERPGADGYALAVEFDSDEF